MLAVRSISASAFQAPSKTVFSTYECELFLTLHEMGAIKWRDRPVTLKSGRRSSVYVDMRNTLSEHPHCLDQLAVLLKLKIDGLSFTHGPQKCVIGIPTGGTQFAQAVSHMSLFGRKSLTRTPIAFRTMREKTKTHGDSTWAGVPDCDRHSYITVEDVLTTGESLEEHLCRLHKDDYPVHDMHHFALIDREQGGEERLRDCGYRHTHSLYLLRDILALYVERGIWTKDQFCSYMEEGHSTCI